MKNLGKRLQDHKSLKVNQIKIRYNGELISFNMMVETRISELDLEKEIKKVPSNYGFLTLIHKKLLTEFERLKAERKKIYYTLYLRAKDKKQSSTGRYYSDDAAKAYAETHKSYIEITEKCIKAKDDADTIYSAVKAIEQKKDLLQTISSNLRSQKF